MIQVIGRLKEMLRQPLGTSDTREKGQALIIIVMGIFGLLILVGLAVDLGLYYIERVRITRAVDSATLAAAYELPMEDAARLQAIDYLLQNGYDAWGPNTALIVDGVTVSPPASGITKTVIYVDAGMYRDVDGSGQPIANTAQRIQVQVRQVVPVIFLRFAGFENISCYASATAENTNNLDVVLVFDKSGSMEFDTLCYGCWSEAADDYPEGNLYPLPWDGPANDLPQHCDSTVVPYTNGGYDYYLIEAEEYYDTSNSYDRDLYTAGYTYWVLQRNPNSASARGRATDNRGAYIMHMPYPDIETGSGLGMTCRYEEIDPNGDTYVGSDEGKCWSGAPGGPYDAPRVSYNFSPATNGNYYIWVRGQAESSWARGDGLDRRLFWGVDEVGDGVGVRLGWGEPGNCGVGCETSFSRGTGYNGASGNWQWRRLNNTAYWMEADKQYFIVFWAGGAEFALDRIAITTNSSGSDGNPPSPLNLHSGRGPEASDSIYAYTNGRDGWACDPCDARFAGYPATDPDRPSGFDPADDVDYYPVCNRGTSPDRRTDDIYDDEQPVRASVEAAKRFARKVIDLEHNGYKHDQIGYVRYSTNSEIASHLQCLRHLGADDCDPEDIEDTVIYQLDRTTAGGSTNIAGGMEDGLEVLSTGPRNACEAGTGPCGRPGAIHVMIVMTDGRANVTPNSYCDDGPQWPGGDASQDCVIYYAHQARDNSVVVYTITLGGSADFELMQEVADLTGGVHRNADRPEKLDKIFEELYDLMYLRLIK